MSCVRMHVFHRRQQGTGYKILISPFMPYISDEYLERAKKFTEAGGIWIIDPMTGWRTGEHTEHIDAGLGKLEILAGVETAYIYSMTETNPVGNALGLSAPLGLLSATFRSTGAKVLRTVQGGVTPGPAVLTEHKIDEGKIVMLGSMPKAKRERQCFRRSLPLCERGQY